MDSNLINAQRRRKRQERSKASDTQLHPLPLVHHVGMELVYTAGRGSGAGQGAPVATPGSPAAPPASIPGRQPQLSHQSTRADREDSGMTCFHCFLSQERGWCQGAGDPVFLHLPPTCRDLGWGSIFLGLCPHYCPQLLWDQVGGLQ